MKGINRDLARLFQKIGDAIEFSGGNTFKIQAYRKVARVLEGLPDDVRDIYRAGGETALQKIPGIGSGIAKKIAEYIETGKMSKYEEVMKGIPTGLLELLDVQGLGPKTLGLAYKELGVENLRDLNRVIKDGTLAKLPGMGEKKVENIRKGLELYERMMERIPLGLAFPLVEEIIERMKELGEVRRIAPAGSFRRMKETLGDLDILVAGENGKKIIDTFVSLPGVTRTLAKGDTKGSCIFKDRYQVDIRVVPEVSFGAALQYFTGSKTHNVHLRTIARGMKLKLSEYGVFKGDKFVCGADEEEIYRILGLPWIPPEIREDMGEIESAQRGELPELVLKEDIKGDLHIHSDYSDGTATLKDLKEKAREMGYEYIVIADHSQSVKYARGLSIERLAEKTEEIDRLNSEGEGPVLLKGVEVDILKDGTLDYPDEILRRLDFVIGAVHIWSKREDITQRILKAMDNPYLSAISHPTGRLISSREGYNIDIDALLEKASEKGIALEINAYYDRLDLSDVNVRRAKERGVKLYIGTDAHNIGQMWMMVLGVGVARRGWLEKTDLLNTMDVEEFLEWCKRRIR